MHWLTSPLQSFWRATMFPYREVFAEPVRALERAQVLVRATYALWAYLALDALYGYHTYIEKPDIDPLWPVRWMPFVPWRHAVTGVAYAYLFFPLLALAFVQVRTFRVLAFVAVLEYQALTYSYGKINHSLHLWVLATFLLIFLPRLPTDASTRQRLGFLEVIWGVQACALSTYTLAGLQKLWGAWLDFSEGLPTSFHPNALAWQIARLAERNVQTGDVGPLFLAWPALGWPGMWLALYLELFSLMVIFRPGLHVAWGTALIGMHVFIAFTMNVTFAPALLFLGLWFLASPFAPRRTSVHAQLRDLPWLGPLLSALVVKAQRWRSREIPGNQVVIFYPGPCATCSRFVRCCLRHGLPHDIIFAAQSAPRYQHMLAEHVYLRNTRGWVVYAEEGGLPSLRLRSEAVLWTLAQLRGPVSLLLILLVIPLPLLNLGYNFLARVSRRNHASESCPETDELQRHMSPQ